MENNNELLPVGSIVHLVDSTHKLMIIGYGATGMDKQGKVFDYYGCLYPEGIIEVSQIYVFNKNDIEKKYFDGYNDSESKVFLNKMEDVLKKYVNENGILATDPANIFGDKNERKD